jgi:hypothetical protein
VEGHVTAALEQLERSRDKDDLDPADARPVRTSSKGGDAT